VKALAAIKLLGKERTLMKTYSNTTLRLTRIIRNGIALTVAVVAVNALQAEPSTPNSTPTQPTEVQPASPNNTTTPTSPDNNANGTEKTSHRAKEFIKDAAQANSAEIAFSELAQSKAMNSDVKQLAQMIVTDHQQNQQQLRGIAQAHGVEIDQSLDWINQHEVNRLQKAKEGDFDKDYTKLMLKDHVKAIKMFTKAADDVQEQDVKEYAVNTLPKLREHLRHAEDAARAVGLDDSTVNSIVKDVPAGGTN
jgi:putative membrane protein